MLLVVSVAGSIGAPPAAACGNPDHCYTLAELGPVGGSSGFNGDDVTIRSNCLTAANASTEFVTNETWVGFGSNWTDWVQDGNTC